MNLRNKGSLKMALRKIGSTALMIISFLFYSQISKAADLSPAIALRSQWAASATPGAAFGTDDIQTETVLFINDPTIPGPVGRLVFKPLEILAVKQLYTGQEFRAQDVLIIPAGPHGNNLIRPNPASQIPVISPDILYLPPHTNNYTCHPLFARCSLFPDFGITTLAPNQIEITYRTSERLTFAYPKDGFRRLRHFTRLLGFQKPVKIAVIGDSISVGGDTSGLLRFNPDVLSRYPKMPSTPGYAGQFISRLRDQFKGNIEWQNFSKGGYTSDLLNMQKEKGMTYSDAVVNYSPDLTIIAFGTNDVFPKVSVKQYTKNIQNLITKLRNQNDQTEFILVASFVSNPEWNHYDEVQFREFLAALNKIANKQSGIAVADLTTLSLEILKKKRYFDLSSNMLNHPNDWAHRLYADVLMSLVP